MKILLKHVNLLNPYSNIELNSVDILIENGIISKISNDISEDKDCTTYDLTNKTIVPGFFDMHVHLREPGREDEETILSGCNAAMEGGFTGIACMPNTDPAIDSAEVVSLIKERSRNCLVDVFPIAACSIERKGEIISPMGELFEAGAVAFSDDGNPIKTSSILKTALEYSKMYNAPIIDHCEDESINDGSMNEGLNSTMLGIRPIPAVSEDIVVARDVLMADYVDGKLHVAHISTKGSVEIVRNAKSKGVKVTAEVTPHHFSLTDDMLKTYDSNFKMSPPLRGAADVQAILEALKDGTIDCIASDHAPHAIEEKEMEFEYSPNGILGLETEVGLTLSELYSKNILTLSQIVEKLSINPRRILNIPVPEFKIDEKANFTILDLGLIWKYEIDSHKSKSKNSPFDKRLFNGKAIGVINNGKLYLNGSLSEI